MKTFLTAILVTSTLLSTAACTRPGQTPLHEQERFVKNNFLATYSEDRITLAFEPGQSGLSDQQRDYISRFVNYYKNAENTLVFVSLLRRPEQEDKGPLPLHNPSRRQAFNNVLQEVRKTGVNPHPTEEIEYYPDPDSIDARAWKGIIDSAGAQDAYADPVFNNYYNPDMRLLENYTKVAVIVREYEVTAANCPEIGYWDWNNIKHVSDGITLGCANQKNFLAQIKNPERIVMGAPMDAEFYSGRTVNQIVNNYDSGNDVKLSDGIDNLNQ